MYATEDFYVNESGQRMVTLAGVKKFFGFIGTTPREMLDAENLRPYMSADVRAMLEEIAADWDGEG